MLMKLRTIQLSCSLLSRPLRKVGIKAGTTVTERRATPSRAKLLVKASGWNSLASPAHRATGGEDQGAGIARHLLVAEMLLEMMRGIFGHDDGLVHQNANGDGDPG